MYSLTSGSNVGEVVGDVGLNVGEADGSCVMTE